MDTNNNVVVKTSKGVIVAIIILVVAVIGLGVYILMDKTENNTEKESNTIVEKENNKTEESKNTEDTKTNETSKEDETKILEEVQKVYHDAFNVFKTLDSENAKNYTIENYKQQLGDYFTEKSITEKIYVSGVRGNLTNMIMDSLFNETNQGERKLEIVTMTNDLIITKGQYLLVQNAYTLENDNYPQYMIFKKESGKWKIDLFE